ncbi:MAG: minor capsid protein [Paraclostridium sp.]
MALHVKLEMDNTQTILMKRNLEKNGSAQRFLTSEIKRLSHPYTPFMNGPLKNQAVVGDGTLTYNQIYAKYQWYGKSKLGKSFTYGRNGSGLRGPKWVLRMWADRGNEVVESVAKYVGGKTG